MARRSPVVIVIVFVAAAVVGLTLWLLLGRGPEPAVAVAGADAASATTPPLREGPVATGSGRIRGRAAPGALVRAFPAFAREDDAAEKACPCDGDCGRVSAECACDVQRARADAKVEVRRRASEPLASATAGPDGAFELGGLAAGAKFDLWAESASALGWRAGVGVGDADVVIELAAGVTLTGKITAPEGVDVSGVAAAAWSEEFGRLFTGEADASGRVVLGPLPAVHYRVLATRGELRGADRVDASEDLGFEARLRPPASVAGSVVNGSAKASGASVRLEAARCHSETKADADGRFSFAGVGTGGVLVTASAEGREAAVGLSLEPGERKEGLVLDLGVSTALAGTVRDAAGKPVAAAEVSYWLRGLPLLGSMPGLPLARRATTTGKDGTWSASPVAAGPYSLQATAPGHAASDVRLEEVAAGERKTVDLVLQPQALLAGRVTDPAGRGVEGVEISIRQPRTTGLSAMTGKERSERLLQRRKASARSEADGAFRVEGLPPGEYELGAEKPGFGHRPQAVQAPDEKVVVTLLRGSAVVGEVLDERGAPAEGAQVEASVPRERGTTSGPRSATFKARADAAGKFALRDLPEGKWMVEAVPASAKLFEAPAYALASVEVRAGEEASVRLRLEATPVISGSVVDKAGSPIADAWVSAHREVRERPSTTRMPTFRSAHSAQDGTFTLQGLQAGEWKVSAFKDLHHAEDDAMVAAGTTGVRLVLTPQAAVRGRVVDRQGAPITSFQANGRPVESPEGRFAVAIRRSGPMSLTVAAKGLAAAVRNVEVEEGKDQDVGTIVLGAGRKIAGTVVEAGSHAPVAGARVHVGEDRFGILRATTARVPNVAVATSDASGAFSLQVEDGPATLQVEHDTHRATSATVEANASTVEIVLPLGAAIRGQVLDRQGKPLRVLVFARQRGGGHATAKAGSDGAFLLGGLAGGTWSLSATPFEGEDRGARLTAEVDVAEGGEASVVLRPKTDGATLIVTLKGSGSAVCAGILMPAGGKETVPSGLPASARSVEGVITFVGVDEGAYRLLVTCGAGDAKAKGRQDVEITGKGELRIEVPVQSQ